MQSPNPAFNPNPYLEMDILNGLRQNGIEQIRKDNTVSTFAVDAETAEIRVTHGRDPDGLGVIPGFNFGDVQKRWDERVSKHFQFYRDLSAGHASVSPLDRPFSGAGAAVYLTQEITAAMKNGSIDSGELAKLTKEIDFLKESGIRVSLHEAEITVNDVAVPVKFAPGVTENQWKR